MTLASAAGSVLSDIIALHFAEPPRILDASYGRGTIWRGCRYGPDVRMDKRPLPNVDVVGDWNELGELFERGSFDIIPWDPPHQTDGGARALGGDWADRYGTADPALRGRANINHLYPPFLAAAAAVLAPGGCVLAKIADQAHGNSRQQLQSVAFVTAAEAMGWEVCEKVPVFTGVKPPDPRWQRQRRIRKSWCYWICAHPDRCGASGIVLWDDCPFCGRRYSPRRQEQRTCGRAVCRQRRHRHVVTASSH